VSVSGGFGANFPFQWVCIGSGSNHVPEDILREHVRSHSHSIMIGDHRGGNRDCDYVNGGDKFGGRMCSERAGKEIGSCCEKDCSESDDCMMNEHKE